MARAGYEADKLRIMLADLATAAAGDRVLAEAWDRSPNELVWSTRRQGALRDGAGRRAAVAVRDRRRRPARRRALRREGHGRRARAREDRRPPMPSPCSSTICARPPSCRSCRPTRRPARRSSAPASTRIALAAARMGEPEQFSFPGANDETVYGYVVKPVDFDAGEEVPGRVPDPRRPAGLVRQPLPLPLEPAGLRRRRLRRRDDRLPRLDRLRPGLHRRDPRRLGRQAATRT